MTKEEILEDMVQMVIYKEDRCLFELMAECSPEYRSNNLCRGCEGYTPMQVYVIRPMTEVEYEGT